MKPLLAAISIGLLLFACSGQPNSVAELRKAGMKAFFNEDYAKARQYLLKAVEKEPSDKELLYFTGMAYKRDYILDSALFYLKKADLLHPDDREINVEIYSVATAIGDWKYALDAIETFVRTGDAKSQYYGELADLWTNMKNPSNAFYYLRKQYTEVGMSEPRRFSQLAGLASEVDSFKLAEQILDSAITRFGASDDFELTRAKIYFNERKLVEAESILRGLAAKYPDKVEIRMNLANSLANQELPEKKREALGLYREAKPNLADQRSIDSLIADIERQLESK